MNIILASASARRKELLKKVVPTFTVLPSAVNEETIKEKNPVAFALLAAEMKARAVAKKYPNATVIAADTIITVGNVIFGKPRSALEAKKILKTLSARTHTVITAVAFYKKEEEKLVSDYESTKVTFKKLSEEQIDAYLATGDFKDKAGAYAVQTVGETFIEKIEGDYDNVVGLPTLKVKELLEKFERPAVTLQISDIAFPDAFGVAKLDNLVIFVPQATLGDTVIVAPLKDNKRFSYAKVLKVEKPSSLRVNPRCPHFGTCGGCSLQNLSYEKQLTLKEQYLLETLKRVGKIDTSAITITNIAPAPDIYYYRNKMEFCFTDNNGKTALGLKERISPFKRYSDEIIPIRECFIFSPIAEKIFPLLEEFSSVTGLKSYQARTRSGFLKQLIVKESKTTKEVMVILTTRNMEIKTYGRALEKLLKVVPEIKSLYWAIHDNDQQEFFQTQKLIFGKPCLEEKIGACTFKIYPQTFLQPNSEACAQLYEGIRMFLNPQGNEKVLELYCGCGAIAIFLSPFIKEAVGIDANRENITAAQENCRLNNVTNCTFYQGPVEKPLTARTISSVDALIVDPPRLGLSPQALKLIADYKASKILYISCNPATLARDLEILKNQYKITRLASFDLFPHTSHLESLALLEKKYMNLITKIKK
jgi:23S rRNA (uracil1939-C5)-methyltransferase